MEGLAWRLGQRSGSALGDDPVPLPRVALSLLAVGRRPRHTTLFKGMIWLTDTALAPSAPFQDHLWILNGPKDTS
ncbi:MAG: hypothetical protein CMJ40_07240 [Phycisphaerae bacterium]|nr:hypothetical protein [Phycisphaerae bacterium]